MQAERVSSLLSIGPRLRRVPLNDHMAVSLFECAWVRVTKHPGEGVEPRAPASKIVSWGGSPYLLIAKINFAICQLLVAVCDPTQQAISPEMGDQRCLAMAQA
jgi:hypothetical protein